VKVEAGTVLKFTGAGSSTRRHEIKEAIRGIPGHGDALRFVDYMDGESGGFVRFREAAPATAIAETSDPLVVGEGASLTFTKVEGDEEKAYFVKIENDKRESAKRPRRGGGGGGSRGRSGPRGRFGGRGRGRM